MGSHAALELPEIVRAIVRHVLITIEECRESIASDDMEAYYTSRATLRSVALVSRVFSRPAIDALWAVLLDAGPLIKLLKAQEQGDAHHDHALRCIHQVQWITINDQHIQYQGDVVQSLMQLVPEGPLLPNIQGLQWTIFPRPNHDVHRLISPSMCAINIHWSENLFLDHFESHWGEGRNKIMHFIAGRATQLVHLEVINGAHELERAVLESVDKQLKMTHLTSIKLDPGPYSMTSPMMRRILGLPLLQHLDIRQFGVNTHESVWSLKLRSVNSGMRYLDSCVLKHSYAELPHTLRQLLSDLGVIRSTRSLTLVATHIMNHVSLGDWRICWRDCGSVIHDAGVSPTIEELHLRDNVNEIGDHGTSSMDLFELLRSCTNTKVVEHSSTYACYGQIPIFMLASEVRRIASVWPGLTHFGCDSILRNNLSHEADSQMTVADLPQIIGGLPATLKSIRISLQLPKDWDSVVLGTDDHHLNMKTVKLRCNAVDISHTPRSSSSKEIRLIENLNENTIERAVGLLLHYFPSMTRVQMDEHPPQAMEQALHVIKLLRTYHQLYVDPPTSTAGREVLVGDVLIVKNGASSKWKMSTCIALDAAQFFVSPPLGPNLNHIYVRFFPESTRVMLPLGAIQSVVSDIVIRDHVVEWSKRMMKWDRLFVLLEWKRVIHDILIASQKQVVDAERAEKVFDTMQRVSRPTADELEVSKLGPVLVHAAAFGTRRIAKNHLKLRAQEQVAMWSDLLSPAASQPQAS